MPHKPKTPSYRFHKPSGQAVVTLNGKDHYLGPHGTAVSRAAYDEVVSRWLVGGRKPPEPEPDCLTVNDLILQYVRHCETRYANRRTRVDVIASVRAAMRPLKRLFGTTPAENFGPLALQVVRDALIVDGGSKIPLYDKEAPPRSRRTVNGYVRMIQHCFRWGVRQELIPPSVDHGLCTVKGLRSGESAARDPRKVHPVPDEHVDAILPYVLRPVRGMIELQRRTGMRPGEVAIMRGRDIDTTGTLWIYRPEFHKTDAKDIDREIVLGPKAQEIVREFLRSNVDEYLFQPKDAVRDRSERAPGHRRADQKANSKKTKRGIRDRYQVDGYRRAIERACVKADVPVWTPHRLRHSYATKIRKEYGIEAARVMLGHQHVGVTEIYAQRDRSVAATVAAKLG